MNFKKHIFITLLIFSFLILLHTTVFAGDLELRNLEYDVTLNSDGSANVTEYWDIEIEETNTLFKTFENFFFKFSPKQLEATFLLISVDENEEKIEFSLI